MADFLKNLTNKVSEIAANVKNKAVDVYDITKLKLDLRKKEADLDECFEKLGRAYYLNLKFNGNNEKVEVLLETAESISNEINDLKKKIAFVQNKKICVHCGSIIDKNKPYCQNCGQKVVVNEKNTNDTEEEYVVEILDD